MQKLLFVVLIGWLAVAIASTKSVGEGSKSAGESSRSADGDSMTVGEITKSAGETPKPTGGESSKASDASAEPIGESSKTVDEITKSVDEKPEVNEIQKVDFDALEAYLVDAKMPDESDKLEANLDHIRSNISQLESGAKEAAHILLELAGGCSDGMMVALLELERSHLVMNGPKKIERLLADGWTKAFRTCQSYIGQKYNQSSPSKIRSFFQTYNIYLVLGNDFIRYGHRTDQNIYLNLIILTRRYPNYIFNLLSTGRDFVRFNRAFDELLVEPCKQIKSNYGLVNNMAALTFADRLAYEAYNFQSYWFSFGAQLKSMNWTRDLCTRLINMDQLARTNVFNSVHG